MTYLNPSTVIDMSDADHVFLYPRKVYVEALERGEIFGKRLLNMRHGRSKSDVRLVLVLLRGCVLEAERPLWASRTT